jgi:TIR domain
LQRIRRRLVEDVCGVWFTMADIFISYSKSDHALALKLSTYLESEGWTVWWDKSLGAADLYRDEIMKQLVAARAVITIWTQNSIKSDWVRAEAGRAKADGKLIPVKKPELTYADIPLPFGEMHTENISSTDLIRAAIVAQLAKPAVTPSTFWQITSTFKYNVLTWIGIVGSAVTLFANLSGVLDLADWARQLVAHWHEWNQIIWGWVFSLIRLRVPRELVPPLSFIVFAAILVVGVNLSWRTEKESVRWQHSPRLMRKVGIFVAGVLLYLIVLAVAFISSFMLLPPLPPPPIHLPIDASYQEEIRRAFDQFAVRTRVMSAIVWISAIGFPIGYLLYFVKDRTWVLIASLLFLFMGACLLFIPLWFRWSNPASESDYSLLVTVLSAFGLIQICWMAVILFSPLQQLTRRLIFVVLGVLTLVVLSEISKLNLHQYLQPTRVSDLREYVMRV